MSFGGSYLFAESLLERYRVIGVIAEEGDSEEEQGRGIAVLKDLVSNKTLVVKVGLPFPGQSRLRVVDIKKKSVTISDGSRQVLLTYQGFSGFGGEVAASSRDQRSTSQHNERGFNQERNPQSWDSIHEYQAPEGVPPFPDDIDELFYQEFGEAPVPPDYYGNEQMNRDSRPLSREELMEKYNFNPEDFHIDELENMVSPPPPGSGFQGFQ